MLVAFCDQLGGELDVTLLERDLVAVTDQCVAYLPLDGVERMRLGVGEVPANRQAPIRCRAWCELGLGCVRHWGTAPLVFRLLRVPALGAACGRGTGDSRGRFGRKDGGASLFPDDACAPLILLRKHRGLDERTPPGRRPPIVRVGCRRAAGAARAQPARWPPGRRSRGSPRGGPCRCRRPRL